TPPPGVTRFNWPIFSSSVILAIRPPMKLFILASCANRQTEQSTVSTKSRQFFFMICELRFGVFETYLAPPGCAYFCQKLNCTMPLSRSWCEYSSNINTACTLSLKFVHGGTWRALGFP